MQVPRFYITNYGQVMTYWIFQIDVSQNNKSAKTVDFQKSSHICSSVQSYGPLPQLMLGIT